MSASIINKSSLKVLVVGSISCNTEETITASLQTCTKTHPNCEYYACEGLCAISNSIKNAELNPLESINRGFYDLILVLPEFGKSALSEIQVAKSAKTPLLFT